jgi:hypothetical protein
MAIGRITGPMLVRNLERQGIDLSIEGNLIYFDVTRQRIGVGTSTPNVALDVVGSANITSNLFVGNVVTVGNNYTLPTTIPGVGHILTAYGGELSPTYWAPGPPENAIRRRKYSRTITTLLGYGTVQFVMELGVSSVVYGLTVSRPVKIEVFGTPARNEPNPYTFIGTPDHLTDDGTVILNDGSSFQSRQYSIFANLEDPPNSNIYVTMTSIDSYLAATPVTLELWYYPAVTDSNTSRLEVMPSLPASGYNGQLVYNSTTSTLYIRVDGSWVAI